MLGKLIKNEFKSTAPSMFGMFMAAGVTFLVMLLVFLFYVVFAPLSIWLEHILADILGWHWIPVTILNMLLNLATEFPFQRFVVFRKTIDTNDLAKKETQAKQSESAESEQ